MNLHPVVVHFSIALMLASVLFDLVGLSFQPSSFHRGAVLLLVLGVICSIGSGLSGDLAAGRLSPADQSLSVVGAHQKYGTATVWFSVLLLLLRMFLIATRRFAGILRGLYLVLGLVTALLLSVTGYFGGSLVFEHGIGVKQKVVSPSPP